MKNLDNQSQNNGLSGTLARNGNITDKEFNVHYSDDIQEMSDLHERNGRPISVFSTEVFKEVRLDDNNSLMALELSKSVSISREELEQVLNERTAICFHGDHIKSSEILDITSASPEKLAKLSREKTIIALSPNISDKCVFVGLESIGRTV